MSEEQEIRTTHEEVEGFVEKLRDFHGSLSESEQAMLGTIVQSAQGEETGGYALRVRWDWNDLAGWIENQGEEDTQGFVVRYK
jgi:hypothetical protein